MVRGPSFRSAILFSSLCHLLLFVGGSHIYHFESNRLANGIVQQVEVFYSNQPARESVSSVEKRITGLSQEVPEVAFPSKTSVTTFPGKAALPKVALPPVAVNKPPFSSQGNSPQESALQEDTSSESAIIAGLHLNHEEKPIYLGYYQTIREKIRRSVHGHYPQGFQKGQVLLTFVLFSNGRLKEVTATEKNFFQDRRLKGVVVGSVIEASPFPPFPEGLHRPFVPFRVMVTFVNEKSSY